MMSNEIKVNIQVQVKNPSSGAPGYANTVQQNRVYNQLSRGASEEIISVPVVAQNYVFNNIATPGFLYLQNLDPANYVEYGVIISSVFHPLGMLAAGECHFLRLSPSATLAMAANLQSPDAPTVSEQTTGGTVGIGTYEVEISYVNAAGESVASSSSSVTTTSGTSTITIDPPPATGGAAGAATGWYAYVTQAGGGTFTRQQASGSPTAMGTALTLTAPPTSSGAAPLTVATTTPVTIQYWLLND